MGCLLDVGAITTSSYLLKGRGIPQPFALTTYELSPSGLLIFPHHSSDRLQSVLDCNDDLMDDASCHFSRWSFCVDRELQLTLDRIAIRGILEKYCSSIDARDFETLASCFTDDCSAQFSVSADETVTAVGGQGVAQFCRAILNFRHSVHAISHAVINVEGDKATSKSLLIATLIYGSERGGRAFVRGVRYTDTLLRAGGNWLIDCRSHQGLWQFDAPSQMPGLPSAN